MCQSLGYHRIGTYTNASKAEAACRQFLFWLVYSLDKSLSLRLGRSSTIQDSDVTITVPCDDGPQQSLMVSFVRIWVIESRIQGQIYELLYCPEAIGQSEVVRKSRAQLLLSRLDELETLVQEVLVRRPEHPL